MEGSIIEIKNNLFKLEAWESRLETTIEINEVVSLCISSAQKSVNNTNVFLNQIKDTYKILNDEVVSYYTSMLNTHTNKEYYTRSDFIWTVADIAVLPQELNKLECGDTHFWAKEILNIINSLDCHLSLRGSETKYEFEKLNGLHLSNIMNWVDETLQHTDILLNENIFLALDSLPHGLDLISQALTLPSLNSKPIIKFEDLVVYFQRYNSLSFSDLRNSLGIVDTNSTTQESINNMDVATTQLDNWYNIWVKEANIPVIPNENPVLINQNDQIVGVDDTLSIHTDNSLNNLK